MITIILFVIELGIIFLLSHLFIQYFFWLWFLITTSKIWAIRMTALFLLPGTLIHELSHWFLAELLRVPTGTINLWPKLEEHEGLKMGSVQIAKTDPFRRTVIGLAPLLSGIPLLFFLASLMPVQWWLHLFEVKTLLIITMIIFTSNTMFSSKKDLNSALVPLLLLILIVLVWWLLKLPLPIQSITSLDPILIQVNISLRLTVIIDLIMLILVRILMVLSQLLLGRKIITNH